MKTLTVKIGKGPDKMTFDECMVHIKRVLFWDYIDGEWCDVVPLSDRRWEELAGYIRGAHEREVDALKAENAKLRELLALAIDMARDYDGDRRALRRLVRDMFGQLLNAYDWKELDDFADRMRELGVGGVE